MKKIIYGLLILVGGLVIASNFMVDTSKLDHKLASASGTACRWVSESGYGVGPHQINDDAEVTCTTNAGAESCSVKNNKNLGTVIDIIPCGSNNVNDQKNGYNIYRIKNNEYIGYTGYIQFTAEANMGYPIFISVDDGTIDYIKVYREAGATSPANETKGYYLFDNPSLFAYYTINISPFFSSGKSPFNSAPLVTYDQYPINDGEWNFTCVCAEY